MKKLKIIFAGTPEFAASNLQAIIDSQHEAVAVFTQPDKPAGRGNKINQSAVKKLALSHNIEVFQPKSLKNTQIQQKIKELNADIMVVVAYGLLLPQEVLTIPKYGCINVHGSILPKLRGAAPIQRAIEQGMDKTGVTIMQMDKGLDTGDMLLVSEIEITKNDNSSTLFEKMVPVAKTALLDSLNNIEQLIEHKVKQNDENSSYAAKLTKEEAKLDFSKDAYNLELQIRAFNPWPISFISVLDNNIKVFSAEVMHSENSKYKIGQIIDLSKQGLAIQTKNGILNITKIQLPNKKPVNIADFVNSSQNLLKIGDILL